MLNEVIVKAVHWYHDTQVAVAVLLGAIVQVAMGKSRNARLILMVVLSSIFVAMYIVAPIVEYLGLGETSKPAIAMYALSSLLSIEIMGMLQTVLPKGIRSRLNKYIGVEDDDQERE